VKLRSSTFRGASIAIGIFSSPAFSQTTIGRPTFDCAVAASPMAQAICRTPGAFEADWALTTSYWAAYFSVDPNERTRVGNAHVAWFKSVEKQCLSPEAADKNRAGDCVAQNYRTRTEYYRKSLTGEALAEASLSPDTLIKLQTSLIRMGFLRGEADGEFGADTRQAIRNYRQSVDHSPADFLDASERAALLNAAMTAPRPQAPTPPQADYDRARIPPSVDPRAVVSGMISGILGAPYPAGRVPGTPPYGARMPGDMGSSRLQNPPPGGYGGGDSFPPPERPSTSNARGNDSEFSDAGTAVVAAPLAGRAQGTSAPVIRTVEVTGTGDSPDAARKDAARLAIQQVVGVYVDNRRRIELNVSENKVSEIVNEKVISYTNAYVSQLDVTNTERKDGIFRVTARVGVSVAPLLKVLQDNAVPTVPFDSVTAASTVETLSQEKTGAIELYADLVDKADNLIKVGVGSPSVDPELPSTPEDAWLRIPLTYSVNEDQLREWRAKFELFARDRATVLLQVRNWRRGDCSLPELQIAIGSSAGWQQSFLTRQPDSSQHGVAACFVSQLTANGVLAECLGRTFVMDNRRDQTCMPEKPCLLFGQRAAKIRLVLELLDQSGAVIYTFRQPFPNYPSLPLEQSRTAPEQRNNAFSNFCVAEQRPFFAAGTDPFRGLRASFGDVLVFPQAGSKVRSYLNIRLQNALISRIGSVRARIAKDAS
jgi:peptidoglycan hydrolase-like protein with peptidoglycan-binding domain